MARNSKSLDSRLNIEFLKKEAKYWLKRLRSGDADAVLRLKRVLPEQSIASSAITLRTLQLALARELGFDGWLALVTAANTRQRELREIADEVLKNAIFKGDHKLAGRLFERHRGIASLDIYTAVATGDLSDVQRRVADDPGATVRAGGPLNWPPLLYLAYTRLPGAAENSVAIASILLENGADANASWNDNWSNAFYVITGVIGLGEGLKPTHERADELVELLVAHGADPADSQTFYNISIVDDDTHWLDVLWGHSAKLGVTDRWLNVSKTRVGGHRNLSPMDFMLSLAVSYGHLRRAEWLLSRGANPNSIQAYSGRKLREEALVYGNAAMAALLVRHGAKEEPLQGKVAFQVACRNLNLDEARRLSRAHPELLLDSEVMLTAARENRIDLVLLLLKLGVDVDIQNDDEIRALNLAAGFASPELVKILIAHGADVDRPTKHYGGPLGFAIHFERWDNADIIAPLSRDIHSLVYLQKIERLVQLFKDDPQLINRKHARDGDTPLFSLPDDDEAALAMARFLIDHGADARIANNEGLLPDQAARKRGLSKAAELLGESLKK